MRRLWVHILSTFAAAWLGQAAWAQAPAPTPVPAPTPTPSLPQPMAITSTTEEPAKVGEPTSKTLAEGTIILSQGDDCGCQHKNHWTVGGGLYYIVPMFGTNPAYRVNSGTGAVQQDFTYNMSVAPLGWLAYQSDSGWGVRGRWWQVFTFTANNTITNNGATSITPASPLGVPVQTNANPGVVFNANTGLRLYVYDLEGTHSFQSGAWNLLVSAGGRYGHIGQTYNLSAIDGTGLSSVDSATNFTGAGPTFALESHRNLGGTGFSLYGSGRGSLLFGTRTQSATTSGVAGTGGTSAIVGVANVSNMSSQNTVLPIGELEVGGEYGRNVGRFRLYAQIGVVGQIWWGAGNGANVDSAMPVSGTIGAATNTSGSSNNNTNLGFIGGVFRLGVNF